MTEDGILARRLGLRDAVVIGLGSTIGAGVFAAFAPAADAAGSALLLALAVAAVVAYANAMSSARLAAMYPESGGTYVYGRERLGPFWGYLAGWGFVVGKTASCAAMALTVGYYAAPQYAALVGAVAVAVLTGLNYTGVQKSATVTRVIVVFVLLTLTAVVAGAALGSTPADQGLVVLDGVGVAGTLQGAAFLFFAFAGYARIATLGEEVRDPARTIPRAIPVALGIALAVYAAVAVALLAVLGPAGIAETSAPLAAAAEVSGWAWLDPLVRVGAVVAAVGSLLSLLLGVSRTTLAMARDGHLPRTLAAVHPRYQVPHHAELAVGALVIVAVLVADVRSAIGFSSFAVLAYYAIANASALTVRPTAGSVIVPTVGLIGCVALAASLPPASTVAGIAVLTLGGLIWALRRRLATTQ
ncbi:MAG TPA: amino acid permease [Ornithinibacter sp.]|nr:amino acid permease [Ornithinibacter sp.]